MTIITIADLAGGNTATRISSTPNHRARVLFVTAIGSGAARIGDVNVGAARGAALPQNVLTRIEASGADAVDSFDLYNTWVYTPSGTTLSITYGV